MTDPVRPNASVIFAPKIRALGPTQLWLAIFAVWIISLTGLFGFPGVLQSLRLQKLLDSKQAQISQVQADINRLQQEALGLEKNKFLQQREIRRVLGYASPDEIIFDFVP